MSFNKNKRRLKIRKSIRSKIFGTNEDEYSNPVVVCGIVAEPLTHVALLYNVPLKLFEELSRTFVPEPSIIGHQPTNCEPDTAPGNTVFGALYIVFISDKLKTVL